MTDFNAHLLKLNKSLGVLQERAAKHAGSAPPELLNQIDDHKQAIALTEQAKQGKISEAEWREQLKPLLVSVPETRAIFDQRGQQVGTQYNIAGDLIYQQAPPSQIIAPAILAAAEQRYRERLKARYAEDAPYYIPLAGETTEAAPLKAKPKALQLALRHRRKTKAEYYELKATEQEIKRIKLDTLRQGVDKYACIILLGDPGSGKTTALEHLAYEFANGTDQLLPLPLRLSEFGAGLTVESFIEQSWGGSEQAGHWDAPELAANLTGYLEEGKLFLLFDALNEMPQEGYAERTLALRGFIDKWSGQGNRVLVTCRVLDYSEELSGLQRIEVQPFTDNQIKDFIRNVLPDDWQALWQTLVQEKEKPRRLLEMARNPYMLTMMAVIFDEVGHLSRNRVELMTDFTQMLMAWAKEKVAPGQWLDAQVQAESLAVLAFETQARSGFGTMIKTELVKAVMPETVQPDPNWPPVAVPPDQVLTLAASANIIEMPGDRSSVRFYHQLLQEYFAAREILKRNPENLADLWRWPWLEKEMPLWARPEDNWDPLPPPPPTGWEETTILAAGLAIENDDQLVRTLIQVNPVLAGRCLSEGQAKVDQKIRQAVIEALLSTIARSEVALRVRIAAGETLGYLGDPRLGELVTVSAGEFLMGDDKGRDYEKPQHKLFLPEYRIGKYPVTNVEYGRFIQAGGYKDKQWWTEAGWAEKKKLTSWDQGEPWTKPRFWQDSRFNKPNQPVVGVSWYECVAYCRWLSAETGQQYRLPTEAEWEKAARGPSTGSGTARQYPWGNKFEASRLNVKEGEQTVRATTPVGAYPNGASPYGCLDMAGNVWEWCATKWEKPYSYDVEEDEWAEDYLRGGVHRVLRGGSWSKYQYDARCAYRVISFPGWYSNDDGFRIMVSPNSPPSALRLRSAL